MQKSYGEGIVTHTGPESCGDARKGGAEALTGERAGRVFSRVRPLLRDADAVRRSGRPHPGHRYREVLWGPARSQTPSTYGKHLAWEPGDPVSTRSKQFRDASGSLRT